MTSSGTYDFELSNHSCLIEAFDRCGMRPTSLTRDQLLSGRRSLNLELQSWSLRGVNLWEVVPFTLQIAANQAVYTAGNGVTNISPNTVQMLDVYLSQINGGGAGVNIDRIMLPMSRTQYAEFSNKLQPGTPTLYWYEKLISPQMTIYQAPLQGYPTYAVSGYYLGRVQDANLGSGETPDVPYRGIDALCAGLGARLALKFAPEKLVVMKQEAKEAWELFADDDREDVPLTIWPRWERN